MFFRNATLFRIAPDAIPSPAALEAALAEHPLRPCGALELSTTGFAPPTGDEGAPFTFHVGNWVLFTVAHDNKILPATAVNAALKTRLASYSKETGRPASGRKRREIKSALIDELLPKALTAPTRTNAYLDTKDGWVIIDCGSRKGAEEVLTALRNATGSFPAVPVTTGEIVPRVLLTDWIAHPEHVPDGLSLGHECALKDPAAGATAKCGKQELESDEVRTHLKYGKQCEKLGLEYNEHMSFTLKEDLSLTKIMLFDGVIDQLETLDPNDAEAEFAARMALFTGELDQLLAAMSNWFGIVAPVDNED